MYKCVNRPDSINYTGTAATTAIAEALDGGAPRYRADKIGASFQIAVQWTLNPDQYAYMMAFYRTATARGAYPFTIDLLWDSPEVQEYTAYIVPGSWLLDSQAGMNYILKATLEVLPLPDDPAGDLVLLGDNAG